MVVAKYPATRGHTTVINNLCKELSQLGYETAIGAFSFTEDPPFQIKKVVLNKMKLLKSGVKYLNYDIIHSHQPRVHYYLLSKKPTKPIIFHYHGAANKIQEMNFKVSMKLYKKRIEKMISVSKTGVEQIEKMIGTTKVDVIYNGADTNFYNTDLPIPFKKGEPQLLFVSALHKYKNAGVLIHAIPEILLQFPNTHLQIVGDGEDVPKLKDLIKKLNLEEKVELTGKVTNEELRLRYSSCDVYLSASNFEVCPVPTLEAMSCGKPLVLYDINPHREIIELSSAGVLFSKLNKKEISTQIKEVIENKEKYSNNAIIFAKKHDWKNISQQVAKIYEEIS
jgi:glycosyltransferase involved in cell wall biosynthesis